YVTQSAMPGVSLVGTLQNAGRAQDDAATADAEPRSGPCAFSEDEPKPGLRTRQPGSVVGAAAAIRHGDAGAVGIACPSGRGSGAGRSAHGGSPRHYAGELLRAHPHSV